MSDDRVYGAIAKGSAVWVPSKGPEEPFVLGHVLVASPRIKVKLASGEEIELAEADVNLANKNIERDNTSLLSLSDATRAEPGRSRPKYSFYPSPSAIPLLR